jgi:hypothetical protein
MAVDYSQIDVKFQELTEIQQKWLFMHKQSLFIYF